MKKSTIRVTVVVLILIVGVVGYYAYLSQKSRKAASDAALTKVEKLVSRDLEKDYPPSPKEVVKYFTELQKCLYGDECSAEEIQKLGIQARGLFDEELQEINEVEDYIPRLKMEIDTFHDESKRIVSISIPASTEVDRFTEDGFEFARLRCRYNVNEKGGSGQIEVTYLLRRDGNKRWKIYGWERTDNIELQDSGDQPEE